MRSLIFLITLVILQFTISFNADGITSIENCIVRVRSDNKFSTGFFWNNGSTIITTLHAISNLNDIKIQLPHQNNWISVSLVKIHRLSDLAMLNLSSYTSKNYLTERYLTKPLFQTQCFTVGFNLGCSNYISRNFFVGLSENNTLAALLPRSLHNDIANWGLLSKETEIVYIDGHLLHGFSGAPVVDFQGKLIGIADGGLENGAAGISWCVSSKYLNLLENSKENIIIPNQKIINALFSAEESFGSENLEYFSYKGFKFNKIKTRTFAQLDKTGKYSSMDSLGLAQLLNNFKLYNYLSFEYDIYLEENTGATIVLPSNNKLKIENNQIISGNDKIKLFCSIEKTNDVQQTSTYFENSVMPFLISNWTIDPLWSYPYPYAGPNNTLVRRKAYYGNNYSNYLFESLTAKGDYFLGAAAIKDNLKMSISDLESWAKFAIAIQLMTFTN